MAALLSVENLNIDFKTKKGLFNAVKDVSFTLERGKMLAVVGESGCGKSITALSIQGLLPGNGKISGGKILLENKELTALSEKELCRIRGNEVSMVFQSPMTSLNPTKTIGKQLAEPMVIHKGLSRKEAMDHALQMLVKVGIPAPERRLQEYPHQLSGGMRQRVMIAMALCCEPKLLIADEPTTALDVTIQDQILALMQQLKEESGTAILFITHDMGIVAQMADEVLILYAGKAVEYAGVEEIFSDPKHPYTQGLLRSIPKYYEQEEELYAIPGTVPPPFEMPKGCVFSPRCPQVMERCKNNVPGQYRRGGAQINCFLYGEEKNA